MMKPALTLLLLIVSTIAMAQEPSLVKGSVTDGTTAVQGATVSLIRATDSALVKLAITDADGNYEFTNNDSGSFRISVTNVGFDTYFSASFDGRTMVQLPAIVLSKTAQALTGVVVQAKRPLVEAKLDKMVVNVDASPSNAGANALELLEKSPGISVDRDGNISLKGKQGVIVLMDGKPTYLSGQDLANLLRSMPASQLDQVEIMSQPSAKFDAAGNSGVINIKTKKTKQVGFNGSISTGYVQGIYPKSPNSLNFNYRKGKFNFFTNFSYTYWKGNNIQNLSRRFQLPGETAVFDQIGKSINASNNFNGRIGVDYNLDSRTTIGLSVSGTNNFNRNRNTSDGIFYNQADGIVDSTIYAASFNRSSWKNGSANLNFKRTLGAPGREVTADLDYIRYDSELDLYTDNRMNYPAAPMSQYLLRAILPTLIDIYSAKVDYVHPLAKEAKLEAGLKTSLVKTDNNAPYETFDAAQDKWVDDVRKDHFAYHEHISAAYVNYSRQIKKWGIQTGLRLEHTETTGKQILLNKRINRAYTQLFPTAYISYGLNDNNQFGLSYGRRIERPNYQDLNPFQRFLDLYTFNQGNPFLTPQFTHNVELTHIFKGKLNTTLNYTYTTDIINDILKQDNETKVTFQTKENVARRRNIGLAVSYNAPLTTWWTTSLYGIGYHNNYRGLVNGEMLSTNVMSYLFNINQQFRFAKTWGAEVSGFYQSRSLMTSMFELEPIYVLSFGASKQVLNNKGTIRLSVIDPFRVQKAKVLVNHGNIDMVVDNRWDNRRVGLTFTYRFSKGQNVQQRRRSGSATEEQNRVGGSGN